MAPRVAGKPAIRAESGVMPLRYGDDPLLWAAWLYYEEGMTQSDIAQEMGLSRASVNAYLQDARTRGIVSIEIEQDRFRSLSIARALKDHFGLQDCLVIPSDGGERSLIERLGAAGAQVLTRFARPGDTIAVTWGRTMLALAEALDHPGLADVRIVQATGGTTGKIPWTPEACASRMAEALGARCVPLSAPAIVSSAAVREVLLAESVLTEQLGVLAEADRIILGISSLRPESTIHTSGFLDGQTQHTWYQDAVGCLIGRFISSRGAPVIGPLNERTIGLDLEALKKIPQRIAVAGGIDKVAAILAALRGGYVNVLVTDTSTGRGILTAEGYSDTSLRPPGDRQAVPLRPIGARTRIKKLINAPQDAVDESLKGALAAHERLIESLEGSPRVVVARGRREVAKVGIVIGGGSGHDPGFWGYVGQGLADAAVVGNIFAAPPPGPIMEATKAVSAGAGVLYLYGNFSGDVMNFDMAAEMAESAGIEVRSVVTTDDIASSPAESRAARRGVAGNVFIFKIAGAAAARLLPLAEVEALTRRANARTYTMGLALEPSSLPETRRPSFELGPDDMEIGVGVHGEPGILRQPLASADQSADLLLDRILAEMRPEPGDRVAVLVNSLGSTPAMELYIILRRIRQRLKAHQIEVHLSLVGPYYTSLDMAGVSLTLMHLDKDLTALLDHPCAAPALVVT
ncbi:bifunctional sugar-binding transcriptional regulator/dihydroxyacetone kinase subunit DhaK [Pseudogemmobacter bohemicus]|uniref:bifunctional sugar-binding transcriptional regulator/dihydroxyacetone kinase subunit DhaK n=1 Tax=Pseudogemmobacter bohemicus TaxID=2250708 RepID=UPI000DD3B2B5|nr:dihydroxyacetone kinase subunit DhaK [Pseudogemmobacter bohemicus]